MVAKSKLDAWLSGIIEAGWLAALVLAPLFFNVFSSRVFEPDKISLVRSISLIMLLAWLIKLVSGGQPWLPAFAGAGVTPTPETPTAETPPLNAWQRFVRVP